LIDIGNSIFDKGKALGRNYPDMRFGKPYLRSENGRLVERTPVILTISGYDVDMTGLCEIVHDAESGEYIDASSMSQIIEATDRIGRYIQDRFSTFD
jgi:hypothetical protein